MVIRYVRVALGCVVLACTGCVYRMPPAPYGGYGAVQPPAAPYRQSTAPAVAPPPIAAAAPAPPSEPFYAYCSRPAGYYPAVKGCYVHWQTVPVASVVASLPPPPVPPSVARPPAPPRSPPAADPSTSLRVPPAPVHGAPAAPEPPASDVPNPADAAPPADAPPGPFARSGDPHLEPPPPNAIPRDPVDIVPSDPAPPEPETRPRPRIFTPLEHI